MILTKEFDIKPFIYSDMANRLKIANVPTPEVENNLKNLFYKLILPLMNILPGKFNITSGYRCDKLNAKVKGKPGSQHVKGMAADVEYIVDGKEQNKILFDTVCKGNLEYDQCIAESIMSDGNPRWIHLSYNEGHNRKQAFRIK